MIRFRVFRLIVLCVAAMALTVTVLAPVSNAASPDSGGLPSLSLDNHAANVRLVADIAGHFRTTAEPKGFTRIAAGSAHSCGIHTNGNAYCWGYNNFGQLGNGTNTNTRKPRAVTKPAGMGKLTKITASGSYTCAINQAGDAYCWGYNGAGQLGNGTNTNTNKPRAVTKPAGMGKLAKIKASYLHTCAINTAGDAYCWGNNGSGELGNGTNTNTNKPTAVTKPGNGMGKLTKITASYLHTCAINQAGNAYCWGNNGSGQLGNGTNTGTNKAVAVTKPGNGMGKLTKITAGGSHTCAINTAGNAYCWGYNNFGQLGNGTNTNTNTPVAVTKPTGIRQLSSITAGDNHTCAINQVGRAYCWGYNSSGQLGNGTNTNTNTPRAVTKPAGMRKLASVTAGSAHSCAINTARSVYCWGHNAKGQLGNGTRTNTNKPVPVLKP